MDTGAIVAICTVATTALSAVIGTIGYLFRGWMASNEAQVAKAQAGQDKAEKERDTFRDLLRDAIKTLPVAVNQSLEREGKPPMPPLAPVVPISHSPTTPEQERQAEIFTALAVTAAAKLALGLPARVAAESAASTTTVTTVKEVARSEPMPGKTASREAPETIIPDPRHPGGPGGPPVAPRREV